MGFMHKAKKVAEQAQAKLDEAQGQFNARPGAGGIPGAGGPVVEYDQHGRPLAPSSPPPSPSAETEPGSPLPPLPPTPPEPVPPSSPATLLAPPDSAPSPVGPGSPLPPAPPSPPPDEAGAYEPPKLSSGDPLA